MNNMSPEPTTPIEGLSVDCVAEMLSLVFGTKVCEFVLYLDIYTSDEHHGVTMSSVAADDEELFVERIKHGD